MSVTARFNWAWALHAWGLLLLAGGAAGTSTREVVLIPSKTTWRYSNQAHGFGDGGVATWMKPHFDDSGWFSGTAPLGTGASDIATQLRPNGENQQTLYFRRWFAVEDPGSVVSLELQVYVSDGAVVYLNGNERARANLARGPVGPSTFAVKSLRSTSTSSSSQASPPHPRPLTITLDSDELFSGANLLAIEVHDAPGGGDAAPSVSFDAYLKARYRPQSLVTPGSRWRFKNDGTSLDGLPWKEAAFPDDNWAAAAAPLSTNEGGNLALQSAPTLSTAYFRHKFLTQGLGPGTETLYLRVMADDGAVVFLNGVEVFRGNIEDGPVVASTAAQIPIGALQSPQFLPPVVIPATHLVEGENILAVEVHQAAADSRDVMFDCELLAYDPTKDDTHSARPKSAGLDAPQFGGPRPGGAMCARLCWPGTKGPCRFSTGACVEYANPDAGVCPTGALPCDSASSVAPPSPWSEQCTECASGSGDCMSVITGHCQNAAIPGICPATTLRCKPVSTQAIAWLDAVLDVSLAIHNLERSAMTPAIQALLLSSISHATGVPSDSGTIAYIGEASGSHVLSAESVLLLQVLVVVPGARTAAAAQPHVDNLATALNSGILARSLGLLVAPIAPVRVAVSGPEDPLVMPPGLHLTPSGNLPATVLSPPSISIQSTTERPSSGPSSPTGTDPTLGYSATGATAMASDADTSHSKFGALQVGLSAAGFLVAVTMIAAVVIVVLRRRKERRQVLRPHPRAAARKRGMPGTLRYSDSGLHLVTVTIRR